MTDKKASDSRRKILKSIAAGTGAVVAGKSLPENWAKPVVDSVMLPAHAETSPNTPACVRIEFQFPYSAAGDSTPITEIEFPANHDATGGGTPADESYVTAWGYFLDDPDTPVYINTDVIWASSNTGVAHTGALFPDGTQQDSSSITTLDAAGQSAIITATYINFRTGCRASGSYTVNVVA